MMEKKPKEEYAIVLDFLQHGYPFDKRPSHKKTPIAQAIGKSNFTLLELVPKVDIFLQPYEEVYIGAEKRGHHSGGNDGVPGATCPLCRLATGLRSSQCRSHCNCRA